MKYLVTVEETLRRSHVVEAESEEEAWEMIDDAYADSEIILDADDFIDRDIHTQEITEDEIKNGTWDYYPTWPPTINEE